MSHFVLSPLAGRLFPAGRSLSTQAAIIPVYSGQLTKTSAARYAWGSAASALKIRTWSTHNGRNREYSSVPCSDNDNAKTQASAASSGSSTSGSGFCVVNFYHLLEIPQPQAELELHRSFIADANLDLKGRIYISSQGVNAQYSGPPGEALAYADWLKGRDGFESLRWHIWEVNGHQFPKLRLQNKAGLIQLKGGTESLPITEASQRATPLEPSEWREMLKSAKRPLVLDVRNNYEWDAGHFQGAARPIEENFVETPAAPVDESSGSDVETSGQDSGTEDAALPAYLEGVGKDEPIMMYCTGGIRCDIYSAYLRKQGFDNLYTLEGGIANYLNKEGDDQWNGSMFVFDDRLALGFSKNGDSGAEEEGAERQLSAASDAGVKLPAAVQCQLCGGGEAVLPHLNCANVLCNKLFISCDQCRQKFSSCCCSECTTAPRLRIRLDDGSWTEKRQEVDDSSPWAPGNETPDVAGRVVTPVVAAANGQETNGAA